MTYDVEHFSTSIFAICILSLVQCLFRTFGHFLIDLFVFLLFILRGFFYILDKKILSGVFCKYFSPSLWFILLTESLAEPEVGEFDFEVISLKVPLRHQRGNGKQAGRNPGTGESVVRSRDPKRRVWLEQKEQDSVFRDLWV